MRGPNHDAGLHKASRAGLARGHFGYDDALLNQFENHVKPRQRFFFKNTDYIFKNNFSRSKSASVLFAGLGYRRLRFCRRLGPLPFAELVLQHRLWPYDGSAWRQRANGRKPGRQRKVHARRRHLLWKRAGLSFGRVFCDVFRLCRCRKRNRRRGLGACVSYAW